MTIEVLPVTNSIGAEVRGVDLRSCSDTELEAVRDALHEHQVIFLRAAHLSPEDHLAVARRFGTPSIFPLARLKGATEPSVQVISDGPDSPPTAEMWHTDVTWTATPPRYALLCGEVVPAAGGDTLWASMTAAYEALSPAMQEMLAGLEIEHTTDSFVESLLERGNHTPEARALADRLNDAYPRVVVHPLVRTHPENGRRILFLGGASMDRIRDMRRDESDALLDFLRRHVTDERFQCRWRWSPGDLAIWDERSTMHRAAADHFPQHRTVCRIEIDGDRPYFDPEAHLATAEAARPNDELDLAWQRLCDGLRSAATIITDDPASADPALRAAGYRYLLNLLNAGLEQEVFSADPVYPEVGHLQDNTKRYATESPDCLFGHAALDPNGTYRLTGTGGRARYIGLTLYDTVRLYEKVERGREPGDFAAAFKAATGSTLAAISNPGGITLRDNGDFEVVISAEPHEGNWLPMPPDTGRLITRQYFYDWDGEDPYHISIERLDVPGAGPVAEPQVVSGQVETVGRFVDGFSEYWAAMYALRDGERNVLRTQPPVSSSYAGDGGNIAYGGGSFEIEPDEALILEVVPPDCHFWNIHLGDYWGQSLDYTYRQTSLNGHQAVLDNGVFRAVVAHRDPGVANWIDTAGNRFTRCVYRWWMAQSGELPTPTVRKVKFADLRRELPESTIWVTPAERRELLGRRRAAVLARYSR